jgi:acryloyl-coenzyme A reductase
MYKAVQLAAVGGPKNLVIGQVSRRAPGPGEVTLKVAACAVAYRDVLDRKGAFKFIRLPAVLGHEFSGTVVAVGPMAGDRVAVGDPLVSLHWNQDAAWPSPLKAGGAVDTMFGISCDGGYAEYVTCPAGSLAKAPTHIPLTEAACVVSTFGTVWWGAVARGGLKAGQRVLVTGASGGVGSAAVAIAKALGCHVTGVSTSAAKKPYLEALGCDEVLVTDAQARYKASGIDCVIESVGGPTFASSLRATKPGGSIVLLGNVENSVSELPLGYCILNSITIVGSDSILRSELESNLLPFMGKHQLRPTIQHVMPLEEASRAHEMLEARQVSGRILLVPSVETSRE